MRLAPGARDAQGEIGCAFARFDGEVNRLVLGQIAAPLIPEDQKPLNLTQHLSILHDIYCLMLLSDSGPGVSGLERLANLAVAHP